MTIKGVGHSRRGPDRDRCRHVRDFAQILTQLQGDRFLEWITAVRADDLPSLHTFVNGIERDLDAVIAGLTEPPT
ncbi:hypothetical protein OH786_35620 (plasmid) [Streptomyces atratus]|uniref:Uncharacterized protein n=1 Tax=Streptomyces atratus TaxID=1893 RepID=A0A1K1ZRZ9_STRAR|nr:hypothetical protein [Streptomyces atratus]SFX76840.1 hypothetical protein SAMN02787144_100669 [Streptomyces atratus]